MPLKTVFHHRISVLLPVLFSLVFFLPYTNGQLPGSFRFDTLKIPNWPAIHSFSYATYGNWVLMVGGRTDGIHGKENGFEFAQGNRNIYLWNVETSEIIKQELENLDPVQVDYLSAANTAFAQDSQYLYLIGGYGQNVFGSYVTYPVLTRIDLQACIENILAKADIYPALRFVVDDTFAVAGGQLRILDTSFYLAGGHRFDGKYSNNPVNIKQTYTDAVRIFTLHEAGDSLQFSILKELRDDFNFHRRDFNMNPVISETGDIQLMVYSGVFQYNLNRPFLNIAKLKGQEFEEVFDFDQKFAAYTCARAGLFDAAKNESFQIFFGGMAEYYRDSIGNVAQDTYVPFVRSVSCVTRKADGSFEEHLLRDELPGYFGTNSEFWTNPALPHVYPEIIDLNRLSGDSVFLGYLFGGIYNPLDFRNPWQFDMAHRTLSNPYLIRVTYLRNTSSASDPVENKKVLQDFLIYPNPASSTITIKNLQQETFQELHVWIQDPQGRMILNQAVHKNESGEFVLPVGVLHPNNYSLYILVDEKALYKKQLSIIRP